MGVSKVDYYGETLIDLTSDTISEETALEGTTFTDATGEKKVGTFVPFSGDYNDLINKPDIESVVNEALGEAKESGEFDGAKGDKGDDGTPATHSWNGTTLTITSASGTSSANLKGEKGDDGYTPQKGVDYFDGQNGSDGVSVTHSWSGTTLRITSASGTSSANLKGDNGYTPVKGTDYFTNADKQELVTSVINALPTWTGGSY